MKTLDYLVLPLSLIFLASIYQLATPREVEYIEMCGEVTSFYNYQDPEKTDKRRYLINVYYKDYDRNDIVQVSREDYFKLKVNDPYNVKEKIGSGWIFLDTISVVMIVVCAIMTFMYFMFKFD
jgi:hypothetical protein